MRKRYENLDGLQNQMTLKDVLKWRKERKSNVKDLNTLIPQAPMKRMPEVRSNRTQTSYTWIGHSTFLIQLEGLNILTDPVWAERMGFEKRLTAPGAALEELPEIDAVLVSHGHYDHLDFPTIRRLKGNPTYYVPVGLKRVFRRKGYEQVVEANWWDCFQHGSITLHFVPAQHWTRRSPFDMNRSHWGGWVLQTASETLYFVGDTGYFRGFREIGERFEIDTVFMPIGAYEPEWFMAFSHINPEDAVRAYMELHADIFVPMHYGAYRLADDVGPEALDRLLKEWERLGLGKDRLHALKIGETVFTS